MVKPPNNTTLSSSLAASQPTDLSVFDALDKWPALVGNVSERTKLQDKWTQQLARFVLELQKEVAALRTENASLRDTVEALSNSCTDIRHRVDTIERSPPAADSDSPLDYAKVLKEGNSAAAAAITAITAIVDKEELEKRKREGNLVVTNIDEKPEAPDHDLQTTGKILTTLGVDPREIHSVKRLGIVKPDSTTSRPRPLLLQLKTKSVRDDILAKARQLRGTPFNEVYIKSDLTSNQLSALKKLREERDARNGNLPSSDGPGRHFDVYDGGKWYWGIRNLELRRIDVQSKRIVNSPRA